MPLDHDPFTVLAIFVAGGIFGLMAIAGAAHFCIAVEMACILSIHGPMIRCVVLEGEVACEVKKSTIIIMEFCIQPAPPEHTVMGQMGF
jgi:hypothetical protein